MASNAFQQGPTGLFNRQTMPMIGTFLIWGTGSGAQSLARALFAYHLTGSVFLVTVLIAGLAAARMVSGPLTGYLSDHWGRKPMAVAGATLRGIASALVIFTDHYAQFFVLEFIGTLGVSMWQTTSQVIVTDLSTPETRGRAAATRNTTLRLGQILGPLLGGVIAGIFSLQAVFLVNSVSKFAVAIITWRLVRETKPLADVKDTGIDRPPQRSNLQSVMKSRAFVALGITTFAVSMMNQGVFMTMFPIVALDLGGLTTTQIGTLIGTASFITFLVSFPNGMLVDRYGRKPLLVPGLVLASGVAILLALITDFRTALQAACLFGVAQAMMMGANQAFAMDLAPGDRRGAFLGVWSSFQSFGGFVGPLAVGALVEIQGFGFAFSIVCVLMLVAAGAMIVLGPPSKGTPSGPDKR